MSIPTLAFLDTSIFDGQKFNFSSTAFSTFAPACKKRGVKLILPDPTEREIQRHIREKSEEAVEALDTAVRKAPFLAKWRRFAQKAGPAWEVHQVASEEWRAFMSQFEVIRVGYQSLDIAQVMKWYDQGTAPFGKGKKRKEFPDALSISILDAYAQKNSCYVAVVSTDPDFELACKRFPSLLHFKNLQGLTELLISDDSRLAGLQAAIQNDLDVLEEAVYDEVLDLQYHHSSGFYELLDDFEAESLMIGDVTVVAIGNQEATITFAGSYEVRFEMRWEEQGSDDNPERFTRSLEEEVMVSGTAKVMFDPASGKMNGVSYVGLDTSEIELSHVPHYWKHGAP